MKKFLISFLLVGAVMLAGCTEESNPALDAFAQCLNDAGAIMYGTEACPHCRDQKAMFGDSLQYIDYIGCDKDKQICLDAGVEGVPAWDFEDGERLVGTQPLEKLADKAGCELNLEE